MFMISWLVAIYTFLSNVIDSWNDTPVINTFATKPLKNSDGSCAFYIVKSGDDCDSIATSHGISVADLVDFNNNGHS